MREVILAPPERHGRAPGPETLHACVATALNDYLATVPISVYGQLRTFLSSVASTILGDGCFGAFPSSGDMTAMGFTKFTLAELEQLSKDRLEDAMSLLSANRFAACYYLCGYALELVLKYRIAKQLNWPAVDINDHPFLKIHDLDKLVKYTGVFGEILRMPQWNTCRKWTAESRYQDANSISEPEAEKMLVSSRELVSWLLAN